MNRLSTVTESPEFIWQRQETQQAEIKERQALLKGFLGNVKKMIRDQAKLHLPTTVDETQRSTMIQPQVFLSYAWEAANTPKLTHLHTLLKQLNADLEMAGLTPWLDIKRMTGELKEQMRLGIQDSQYVLLIGTNRYAERTKPGSQTNVREELDFTLVEAKKSPDFLLPLMLEGDYSTTFPTTVSRHLIRDCRTWYSLEQGQWQSQENYIKGLTQLEDPIGILPSLLGLNRRERSFLKYRLACVKQYGQLQLALMNALVLLQRHHGDTDSKRSPSRPSIQLTPVLQIPFKELEYDKKADKIGSGSYGDVYHGWWQGKQSVAVKELTGNLTADAEKDLYREAGIMAYMAKVSTEPYPTVRLFGLAVEKPNYALVMEYVPNGTLFDLLQMQSAAKLPWDLRYQLAADIADGVELLHRQHILHRDLRSHNILLNITDGRLRAKLSDFGLSTVKSSVRTHSTVAKKTESVGTRAWMAPELHKRGGQSSPASDIYSYGMVLWELLTHATPFADAQGDTSLISDWVVKDRLTETIPEDCPPQLAELIKKCWAFKPEDRILMDGIQKELSALLRVHPLSPETRAIIEALKKSQGEREEKWNARWQGKRQDTEQKQKEKLGEVEIKKQAEIAKLQQQHQAEQLALQKQMEQLQLAHGQQSAQLAAAAEEKQRLEAEKQKEIERLKQQHQAEFKRNQEKTELKLPSQTPVTPTKTMPIPAVSQIIPHTLMPSPKPKTSAEQLKLQDQLITACKQGDEKAVTALFKRGAKPDIADAKGEQPLGAAVWGMCPDVVNALLKQAGGVAPMTWDECEKHNFKHYKEVFIVPKFDPQTYGEWYQLLQKMDPNPFIRAYHLKKADEQWHHDVTSRWEKWREYIGDNSGVTKQSRKR